MRCRRLYLPRGQILRDEIQIVCVTDQNYLPHFAALLNSIACNKGKEEIRIHAILDNVESQQSQQIVNAFPTLSFSLYPISDHKVLSLPPLLQISRATYLRLIVDELLADDIKKIITLDIDIITTSSLVALWRYALDGRMIGAVTDPGVNALAFSRKHGLPDLGGYFNAGVMLIDLDAARRARLFPRSIKALFQSCNSFEYADQDALNYVVQGDWAELDITWNFQRKFFYEEYRDHLKYHSAHQSPAIIHFTETVKPWQANEWHPYAWLYWKNLRATPFFRNVLASEKLRYTNILKSYLRYAKFKLSARLRQGS